jgi:chorismate mutase/prephenate dehydratase
MALSRLYQHRTVFQKEAPLLPPPASPPTGTLAVAYSGVRGAWAEAAAAKCFEGREVKYQPVELFADIFNAVKSGKAHYGVVPIYNSLTGAIGETYDLLRKHGCYITGQTQLPIKQCLLSRSDAGLRDIRQVYSHPEGFSQCRHFLSDKSWDLIPESNTALAAKKLAENKSDESKKYAVIASRYAAEVYGLKVLAPDIMDSQSNRTNFIVIAAQPEYNESTSYISLTFSVMHRSGSLCEALLPFYAGRLNLSRIESRPSTTPESYRFFAEIEGNISDPAVIDTLRQAAGSTEYLEVLGCYKWLGERL